MERGGLKIKKAWHASSGQKLEKKDLSDMVGRWDINIDVKITKPHKYTKGPVKHVKY
jgi:hypothetical protein